MLFSDRQKQQLPYLTGYLQYALSVRPQDVLPRWVAPVAILCAVAACAPIALAFVPGFLGWIVAALGVGLALAVGITSSVKLRSAKAADPEQMRLDRDSRQIAERLTMVHRKRRLHRDLSADVSAILEEGARNWTRARAALESPYWNRPDLSSQLQSIRVQSLRAADRAMQELLVLFSTSVPMSPNNWSLAEVADEVVGKQVFAPRQTAGLSPYYEDGLRLAQRLSELASEAESVSRRLLNDPDMGTLNRPGAAIESTLMELRSLRQAEEELEQDLRA